LLLPAAVTNVAAIQVLRAVASGSPVAQQSPDLSSADPASVLRLRGISELLAGDAKGAVPILARAAQQEPTHQLGRFWLAQARAEVGMDPSEDYRAAGALPYLLAMASDAWVRGDCRSSDRYGTLAAAAFPTS